MATLTQRLGNKWNYTGAGLLYLYTVKCEEFDVKCEVEVWGIKCEVV